jgi:hypothetical protein
MTGQVGTGVPRNLRRRSRVWACWAVRNEGGLCRSNLASTGMAALVVASVIVWAAPAQAGPLRGTTTYGVSRSATSSASPLRPTRATKPWMAAATSRHKASDVPHVTKLPVKTIHQAVDITAFGDCLVRASRTRHHDDVARVQGTVSAPPGSRSSGGRVDLAVVATSGGILAVGPPESFYIGEGTYYFTLTVSYPSIQRPAACMIRWSAPRSSKTST